ncbi:MAG: hypothetical protein U0768_17635 [Anaerolineae bacterium]
MNATLKVMHLSPGRIRLHISNTAAQPEVYHRVVQFVLSLPEVTRVELEPASESLTIFHARTPQARDAILQTLRGTQAPASQPFETPAPAAAAPRPAGFPYADCAVAHTMPGRVRLSIPAVRTDRRLAGVLEYHLRQQPGVKDVTVNRLSEAVTIAYDPTVLDAEALVKLIAAYNPDAAALRDWQADRVARRPRRRYEGMRYPAAIALAAGAVALNYVGAPGLAIFALLLVSSLPIFWRAIYPLITRARLTPAVVAAVVIVLLWATGHIWQTALVIIALTAVDWVLSRPNASVANAIADALDNVDTSARARRKARQIAAPATSKTSIPRKSLPTESADEPGAFATTPLSTMGTLTSAPASQITITPETDSTSGR